MQKFFFILLITIPLISYGQTIADLNDELKYMAAREMILSKNLANIDTPQYKPQDIIKKGNIREGIGLAVTHKGHMQIDEQLGYHIVQGDIIEIKPNGNGVTAENELAKKNENAMSFSKTSNVINTVRGMTKTAISGGK